MANEFIARNGLIAQNNSVITGSLNVTAGITGSLQGTASFAVSASWAPAPVPGGVDGNIQFNNNGTFDGDGSLYYDYVINAFGNGRSLGLNGQWSHAEGVDTTTNGDYSHAEGSGTYTIGEVSHTEGRATVTVGAYSHAEGFGSRTGGTAASCSINNGVVQIDATLGDLTVTYADGSIIWFGDAGTAGAQITKGIVTGSSFNGTNTIFQLLNDTTTTITLAGILDPSGNLIDQLGGYAAHAEGGSTVANGDYSHAEGASTTATGNYSHAEGNSTAYGAYSHAEGGGNTYGDYSHAEGAAVTYGNYSHAEGGGTSGHAAYQTTIIASGSITFPSYYGDLTATFTPSTFIYINDVDQSTVFIHEVASSLLSGSGETKVTLVDTTYNPNANWYIGVQGNSQPTYADVAIGDYSHAEGGGTITLGYGSHAEGLGTTTHGFYQNVVGQYNAPVSVSSSFVIGNGIGESTPSNLLVAYGNNVQITGSLTVSGSSTFRNIGLAVFTGSVIAQAVTGSLQGTASYATQALSASIAVTASYIDIAALPLIQPVTEYETITASIQTNSTYTLPNALTYISSSVYEYIEIFANQQRLRYDIDFIPVTTASIQFNFTIPNGSEMTYKVFRRP
jgi:hypothetical protein